MASIIARRLVSRSDRWTYVPGRGTWAMRVGAGGVVTGAWGGRRFHPTSSSSEEEMSPNKSWATLVGELIVD